MTPPESNPRPSERRVFAGVDGGGTRTRAVLIDAQGRELGRGEHEGAVVTLDRPEEAAEAVQAAVAAAAQAARIDLPVDSLWAGLAGAGASAPRAAITTALHALSLAELLTVGTDVEAAFHDAFGDGHGVLLIAGTGSIVWVRDDSGERRVGGWGRTLGDEGSGYWIGREALRALARAEDGRAPPTFMRAPLLERCGASSVDELVSWVETASKGAVAALAPLVIDEAQRGDDAASAIALQAVDELVRLVRAGLGAGSTDEGPSVAVPVVLWGGLIASGGPLEGRVRRALDALGVVPKPGRVDPPLGAARLALGNARSARPG